VLEKGMTDAERPNEGELILYQTPEGTVRIEVLYESESDVSIAKNYLIEREIKELERIVTMYLDYAENQAARQISMGMTDWVAKLDAFLQFNEYEVLTNAESVSTEVARRLAEEQYATFRVQQDQRFESDFEKEVKRIAEQKDLGAA